MRKRILTVSILALGLTFTSCEKEDETITPIAKTKEVNNKSGNHLPGGDPAACIPSAFLVEKGLINDISESYMVVGDFGEYDLASLMEEYLVWKANCP